MDNRETLLEELEGQFDRFVVFPSDHHRRATALWTIHTWAMSAFDVTPYLYIHGPTQSGKTQTLDVLELYAQNAVRAENMTVPVMFKMIDMYGVNPPTMMIDEVDTQWSGSRNEPKRQILNTGYKRGGSAWRESARDIKEYSTFGPKILAGINNGYLPDTIWNRCLPIPMKPRRDDQKLERFQQSKAKGDFRREKVLAGIEEFVEVYFPDIKMIEPEPLAFLSDRQNEIVDPLRKIAIVMGVDEDFVVSLQHIFSTAGAADKSPKVKLFERIRAGMTIHGGKLFSEDLAATMGSMWTPKRLSLFLDEFGIDPQIIRIGSERQRGYTVDQFAGVFDRYLEPLDAEDEVVPAEAVHA